MFLIMLYMESGFGADSGSPFSREEEWERKMHTGVYIFLIIANLYFCLFVYQKKKKH